MILQQTYQMLCVAASLCSLLCCVAPVTQQLTRNCGWRLSKACVAGRARARALWVKVQLWWLFLCYFVNVKMFARILFLFFYFFYSANAGLCCAVTVWMPCFDAGMRWHCVGYDWHSLCDPTKRPELGAQVLFPPSRAFAKSLCFWLVELRIFTDLNNAASGRASHCVLRLLSVDQNPVGTPRRRNV